MSVVVALLCTSVPAGAQGVPAEPPGSFRLVAVNALLGGLGAGIVRSIRGKTFTEGFVRGAVGGAIGYAGRRVSVADVPGVGLVGRQIGAVGASITRAAALGAGPLDTLVLPWGPLLAYVPVRTPSDARVHVDLLAVGSLAYGLAEPGWHMDVGRSLSSGGFVFTTEEPIGTPDGLAGGVFAGGMVVLARNGSREHMDAVFAHERVHALQVDYLKAVAVLPIESRLRRAIGVPVPEWFGRIDLGVGYLPVWYGLSRVWEYHEAPWEIEAAALAGHE